MENQGIWKKSGVTKWANLCRVFKDLAQNGILKYLKSNWKTFVLNHMMIS